MCVGPCKIIKGTPRPVCAAAVNRFVAVGLHEAEKVVEVAEAGSLPAHRPHHPSLEFAKSFRGGIEGDGV